ncbi:hypothetical protein CEXT_695031 [Caerostris extrusa]|uniref:Uncharacterized protein n=1 Tax=Caerostris extrusa TaxID=172846 RepID=A0AAV4X6N9_CAEEX|nr:hypothetical protein CEXT_695031 [Caerostris extrusa]
MNCLDLHLHALTGHEATFRASEILQINCLDLDRPVLTGDEVNSSSLRSYKSTAWTWIGLFLPEMRASEILQINCLDLDRPVLTGDEVNSASFRSDKSTAWTCTCIYLPEMKPLQGLRFITAMKTDKGLIRHQLQVQCKNKLKGIYAVRIIKSIHPVETLDL